MTEPTTFSKGLRRLTRDQAAIELGSRLEPGSHAVFIAPTGRGKSTLVSQAVPHMSFDRIVMLCPKGADPAYRELGHETITWPPKLKWTQSLGMMFGQPDRHAERPQVWRLEIDIRRDADEALQSMLFHRVLRETRMRKQGQRDSLLVVLDDSQLISDLSDSHKKLVNHLMLIARAKRASLLNMYQGPTFVPRRALDQPQHVLIWRNRDRDVARRLAEIADIDHQEMLGIMASLEYHEALWIDAKADELLIVGQ